VAGPTGRTFEILPLVISEVGRWWLVVSLVGRVANYLRRPPNFCCAFGLFAPEVGHRSLDWPLVACVVNRLSRQQSLFCASELAVPEAGSWWLVRLRLERVASRLRQEQSYFCSFELVDREVRVRYERIVHRGHRTLGFEKVSVWSSAGRPS